MAQRLAELGLFEALLDLGAVAVEMLDPDGRLPVDVGEDEAVAVDQGDLAVERELQLLGVDRLERSGAAPLGDLRGGERHPADDQPQRLVLPAARTVGPLGDLRARHLECVCPGVLGDFGERAPHRLAARHRHREPGALFAQPLEQLELVVSRVDPEDRRRVPLGQQPQRPAGDPRALRPGELLAVAADQLRGQRAAALGPERDVRRVAHRPEAAARRALLERAVHLDLGRVQVDHRRLGQVAPQRPVDMLTHARRRALDTLHMHASELLCVLRRGRRRPRRSDRTQSPPPHDRRAHPRRPRRTHRRPADTPPATPPARPATAPAGAPSPAANVAPQTARRRSAPPTATAAPTHRSPLAQRTDSATDHPPPPRPVRAACHG